MWKKIPLDPRELRLSAVLRSGQSFRWRYNEQSGTWSIGIRGRVLLLRQDSSALHYRAIEGPKAPSLDVEEFIKDYFNLRVKLADLYDAWSASDKHFQSRSNALVGIRILRQDPWENLCCFICSSNNNIKRISQMAEKLCTHFGEFIASHDGYDYYDFPEPPKLANNSVAAKLRQLGFGYRAEYIERTACMINDLEDGLGELSGLREKSYPEAQEFLIALHGVGPKVSDCVCLMSLDKHDCVPVDTHVWQIAQRDYSIGRRHKTLSRKAYLEVQDYFRKKWGDYAGWAHSVLFTGDLNLEELAKVDHITLDGQGDIKVETVIEVKEGTDNKIETTEVKEDVAEDGVKTEIKTELVESIESVKSEPLDAAPEARKRSNSNLKPRQSKRLAVAA
uniref:N-glycosylase/DNA lyase n=1 Tax=Blastobotrys adeninivorans TaxID=409370 RepID=A0A060SYN6_BLAAD